MKRNVLLLGVMMFMLATSCKKNLIEPTTHFTNSEPEEEYTIRNNSNWKLIAEKLKTEKGVFDVYENINTGAKVYLDDGGINAKINFVQKFVSSGNTVDCKGEGKNCKRLIIGGEEIIVKKEKK